MITLNIKITELTVSRFFRATDRAKGLLAAGYDFTPFDVDATAFYVTTPSGATYLSITHVNSPRLIPTCTCPDYVKHGDFCKHLLCAEEILNTEEAEMWETICGEVDARAEVEF